MSNYLLKKLAEGDMRTTGRSDEVVKEVLHDPTKFSLLFLGLEDDSPGVRMRSADALEKITKNKPELLMPFAKKLIQVAEKSTQQEVQWHVAQMFTYMRFTPNEIKQVFTVMLNYYQNSKSNIVKVFSLTALVHLARQDEEIEGRVKNLLNDAVKHGSPSIKSRARNLINS